ncbi:hypothetical protein [Hydrogenophaga sp.]|uniref:hypothetical protein n=1 Tax=Hydrogenophaga sp. TaxID=1904254 RepID=UPI0039FC7238
MSASNLKYGLRFFQFYTTAQDTHKPGNPDAPFGQQPVDQILWGHNIQIFTKCGSVAEARCRKTMTN